MKPFTFATGICAVLLVATIFIAGCTSTDAPVSESGAAPQEVQTIAPAPAGSSSVSPQLTPAVVPAPLPDQGTVVDNSGTADLSTATVDADAAIDPYNSTGQPATMAPDSEDLGDPIP